MPERAFHHCVTVSNPPWQCLNGRERVIMLLAVEDSCMLLQDILIMCRDKCSLVSL